MGVYSKIKRLFTARTNQADKPSGAKYPCWNCNYDLRVVAWSRRPWLEYKCPVCWADIAVTDLVATDKEARNG